jgi:hypothetical protein
MNTCHVQASGAIELLFYGELAPGRRAPVEAHLATCAECRDALEELREIRDVLAASPVVDVPVEDDWTGFMARLDAALAEGEARTGGAPGRHGFARLVPLTAMAALLALVTMSVVSLVRWRGEVSHAEPGPAASSAIPDSSAESGSVPDSVVVPSRDAAFAAVSEQHLERSKLVVLKLATGGQPDDLAYERRLASSLLNDTRLYRLTAEERGMTSLARVMGDLELVLLQTSMSESLDEDAVSQIQRLIRKRDLVTKMNAVATMTGGM